MSADSIVFRHMIHNAGDHPGEVKYISNLPSAAGKSFSLALYLNTILANL